MGWLFGWSSLKEVRENILADYRKSSTHEVIDYKSTKFGRNLWIAIKRGERSYILLYLLDKREKMWGYKDLSECSGPVECDCPLTLLDKTTGDDNTYSIQWREKVRKYHRDIKEIESGVLIGEVVEVYGKRYTIVDKTKKSFIGQSLDTGMKYRLKRNQITKLTVS